jgi:hypothetical protein
VTVLNPSKSRNRTGARKKLARAKFFISYRRSEADSLTFADAIRKRLEEENHETFIDTGMVLGTDWPDEIAERIGWCDYLIVLLSEAATASEMVQAEVRLAHHRRKREHKPEILPIRMNYSGPLDYELDSYLARIQYVMWESADDSEKIIQQILRRAEGEKSRPAPVPAPPVPPVDLKRPQPKVDPRLLSAPDGNVQEDDPFYIARRADEIVTRTANTGRGETLVIKGPRKMGKSSLLVRYLGECQRQGMKVAFLDFSNFADAELENLSTLLREMACTIGEAFGVSLTTDAVFTVPRHLTYFIQNQVLPVSGGPVIFAFDEVDRVLGKPYQGDFFYMLRTWHENRGKDLRGRWKRAGLAMVISTEPYLLIESASRSPFNVSDPVVLSAFDLPMCRMLNERYGSPLGPGEVEELQELLRGHPYLTRLALYRVVTKDIVSDFAELVARSADRNGPFGEHLRALLMLLRDKRDLLEGMRRLIKSEERPSQELCDRLEGAGLVRSEGQRVVPANLVYARFFKGNL